MKKTIQIVLITAGLATCLSLAAWHNYKEPTIKIKETVKIISPDKVDAHVLLTKWQITKMLKTFEEDAHPAHTIIISEFLFSTNNNVVVEVFITISILDTRFKITYMIYI